MALPSDGSLLSLEPLSHDMEGVVYSVKMTEEEAMRLTENDQGLTLSMDQKAGVGRLTVGEEVMTLSLREENSNNFECYGRQGNRCVKVGCFGFF